MNKNNPGSDALFLGIDGGGSKCKAKLSNADGSVVGIGLAGRANPVQGLEITFDSILESSLNALQDAGLNESDITKISAGLGLAGVNLPTLYKQVMQWDHPFQSMALTTDLHIACLGAHAGNNGSVIIAGTGSSGISIVDNQSKLYGAHGFPIGDQGSGAWVGLQSIKAILLAKDGLGRPTELTEAICQKLSVELDGLGELMSNQPPKMFAKLVPTVFALADSGDIVARNIIAQGADYINRLAQLILKHAPHRLSLIGGLRHDLKPWLDKEVQDVLVEPLHSPEDGALFFAQQLPSPS